MSYLFCILLYLLLMNLLALILMGVDKHKARHHQWRIPERTLLLVAALGGSIGGILGMLLFRRKTKHPKFYIGYPAILIAQLVIAWFVFSPVRF